MKKIEILDKILDILKTKGGYQKKDLINSELNVNDIDKINDYINYLLDKKLIKYDNTKSTLKLTINGVVFLEEGGFKSESFRRKYDVKLKWSFWIFSAGISIIAFILNFVNPRGRDLISKDQFKNLTLKVKKLDSLNVALIKTVDSLLNAPLPVKEKTLNTKKVKIK